MAKGKINFGTERTQINNTTGRVLLVEEIGSYDGISKYDIHKLVSNDALSTIELFISCEGGDMITAFEIHDLLKTSGKEIKVYASGLVASAATIIALAAPRENRYTSPHTLTMIHENWGQAYGTASDFRRTADVYDKYLSLAIDLYEAQFTISREEIEALVSAETWFTPQEAFDIGFYGSIDTEFEFRFTPYESIAGDRSDNHDYWFYDDWYFKASEQAPSQKLYQHAIMNSANKNSYYSYKTKNINNKVKGKKMLNNFFNSIKSLLKGRVDDSVIETINQVVTESEELSPLLAENYMEELISTTVSNAIADMEPQASAAEITLAGISALLEEASDEDVATFRNALGIEAPAAALVDTPPAASAANNAPSDSTAANTPIVIDADSIANSVLTAVKAKLGIAKGAVINGNNTDAPVGVTATPKASKLLKTTAQRDVYVSMLNKGQLDAKTFEQLTGLVASYYKA